MHALTDPSDGGGIAVEQEGQILRLGIEFAGQFHHFRAGRQTRHDRLS